MGSEPINFFLHLFYGLVFFSIGVVITFKDFRASALKVARIFWLFSLFAYAHALHEWIEMYILLFVPGLPAGRLLTLSISQLSLTFIAFFALLLFGILLLRQEGPRKPFRYSPFLTLLVVLWIGILLVHGFSLHPSFFRYAEDRLYVLVGMPGALSAGIGFILFSRTTRSFSGKVANSFAVSGIALLAYGILTGLIPSRTLLPQGGIHMELLRDGSAFLILFFIMKALRVFDIEQGILINDRLNRFAQSEKVIAVGKLAAGIAHEINNPLTNISLNVEMLKKDVSSLGDDQGRIEKRFTALERNIERASKIIHELLNFSRENEPEFVPLDLNAVIRSTLTLLGPRKEDYRIELELEKVASIFGLPWKLEEVFLNLLLNAMEASEKEGRIVISTRQTNPQVVAEVVDCGAGIASKNLNKIFDPFFTTKEVGKGTGLGLSICFGIMETHRGKVKVESEEGKGTRVRLYFPAGENHGN
jgi:signal transduction histidine kinase